MIVGALVVELLTFTVTITVTVTATVTVTVTVTATDTATGMRCITLAQGISTHTYVSSTAMCHHDLLQCDASFETNERSELRKLLCICSDMDDFFPE